MMSYLVFELIPPPTSQHIQHFVVQSGFWLLNGRGTNTSVTALQSKFVRVRWPIVILLFNFSRIVDRELVNE